MISIHNLATTPDNLFSLDGIHQEIQNTSGKIVLVLIGERILFDLDIFLDRLEQLMCLVRPRPVALVMHSWWQPYQSQVEQIVAGPVHFIEYFLVQTWYNASVRKLAPISQKWNAESNKFLFLTGVQHRANRTNLLYKFWKSGLLEHAIWSWLLDDTTGHEHLPELSQQEYSFFIKSVKRNAGDSLDRLLVDTSLFEDSLFKVISETDFDGPVFGTNAFFTEKTWKCVINHLPFIMAGNYYYLDYLKNLGYGIKEYIDEDELAQGLVDSDGWGIMNSYDGNYDSEEVNGVTYYIMRIN